MRKSALVGLAVIAAVLVIGAALLLRTVWTDMGNYNDFYCRESSPEDYCHPANDEASE
jgi:hypothetical protein